MAALANYYIFQSFITELFPPDWEVGMGGVHWLLFLRQKKFRTTVLYSSHSKLPMEIVLACCERLC